MYINTISHDMHHYVINIYNYIIIMYSDRVVVSALESEHDASVVSSPRSRHPHLTVVPHPADVVTQ